jgi:hypothetical protein
MSNVEGNAECKNTECKMQNAKYKQETRNKECRIEYQLEKELRVYQPSKLKIKGSTSLRKTTAGSASLPGSNKRPDFGNLRRARPRRRKTRVGKASDQTPEGALKGQDI